MSEDKKLNLHQRLIKVMQAVDYVQKDQKKIDDKYRAVKHDAVIAKVRPELVRNGIVTKVSVIKHEITHEWETTSKYGNTLKNTLTEADVEVTFINVDNPEDREVTHSFGYGIDNQDKGPGKSISYAVKYALLKNLCLETGDDPDNDQGADSDIPPTAKPAPKKPAQPVQPQPKSSFVTVMEEERKRVGDSAYFGVLKEHYNVDDINKITIRSDQARCFKEMSGLPNKEEWME